AAHSGPCASRGGCSARRLQQGGQVQLFRQALDLAGGDERVVDHDGAPLAGVVVVPAVRALPDHSNASLVTCCVVHAATPALRAPAFGSVLPRDASTGRERLSEASVMVAGRVAAWTKPEKRMSITAVSSGRTLQPSLQPTWWPGNGSPWRAGEVASRQKRRPVGDSSGSPLRPTSERASSASRSALTKWQPVGRSSQLRRLAKRGSAQTSS